MIASYVGWPRCARCAKPVEQVATFTDQAADQLVVVASCHGEHETVRVPTLDLAAAGLVSFGVAFAKTLPVGAPP